MDGMTINHIVSIDHGSHDFSPFLKKSAQERSRISGEVQVFQHDVVRMDEGQDGDRNDCEYTG